MTKEKICVWLLPKSVFQIGLQLLSLLNIQKYFYIVNRQLPKTILDSVNWITISVNPDANIVNSVCLSKLE